MNSKDFAVVVGISRYPGLGEQPGDSDLVSPDSDAQLVHDWLTDPAGGGVPKQNVRLVTSSSFPKTTDPTEAEPQADNISKAFDWLDALAESSRAAGRGQKVGRRLYIYMSGHGYSPRRSEGGLFTANATRRRTHNVYASGWLQWFEDMGYFDEYVLWMDCCMDREFTVVPQSIPFRLGGVAQPPAGTTFVAFAARRPLKTVEREIAEDANRVHGVFTWALLNGLKGAAADPDTGSVNGSSLRDYLINTVKCHLNDNDLTNPDISKEPHIPENDERMVFAAKVEAAAYSVKLSFPANATGKARIWGGDPATVIQEAGLPDGPADLLLARGLYVVDVPEAGLRQGFEVTGGGSMEATISDRGPPVQSPNAMPANFSLGVDTGDPAAEIFVIDHKFALVGDARHRFLAGRPFGIYKIKTRAGREVAERVIILDRDSEDVSLSAPPVGSPAPLRGTAFLHEYHEMAAADLSTRAPHVQAGAGAEISLMSRTWTGPGGSAPGAEPWKGITLVDGKGRTLVDLEAHGERHTEGDPFATCKVSVNPGNYFLRQRLPGRREIEQSIYAPAGWRVEAFLMDSNWPQELPAGGRELSLLMQRPGGGGDRSMDRLLDTARLALADERRILSADLENLLLQKFDNPIAGVVGAHLLLVEAARAGKDKPGPDMSVLNHVVYNLRGLVGPDHPDVEAISLKCPDPGLRTKGSIKSPPMFAHSWSLLTAASQERAQLVPKALWQKVRATGGLAPYFVWARDAQTRTEHLERLKASMASFAAKDDRGLTSPVRGTIAAAAVRGTGMRGPSMAVRPGPVAPPRAVPEPEVLERALGLQLPAGVMTQMWNEAVRG